MDSMSDGLITDSGLKYLHFPGVAELAEASAAPSLPVSASTTPDDPVLFSLLVVPYPITSTLCSSVTFVSRSTLIGVSSH
jgi:hypothetical protein